MCGGRVAAYVWDTTDKSWLETLVTSILLYFFLPPPSATNANMEDFIFLATDLHPRKVTFSLTYYILKKQFLLYSQNQFIRVVLTHRVSETDAHFIASGVTLTPSPACQSCCECDVSPRRLRENG